MSAVFSHGRLRLYLLKLMSEGPRHGYELIRLLENRFLGRYAPSAGTIYPRLARMEADGLVTHTAAGSRKVYRITDAGLAELADRAGELALLEQEIHESVAGLSTLATEVANGVRGSVRAVRREVRGPSRGVRYGDPGTSSASGSAQPPGPYRPEPAVESDPAVELERRALQLLAEVRRLARSGAAGSAGSAGVAGVAGAEVLGTARAAVDTALDQIRGLLR
jgi:DNA-binding PadR family transcriptional regulator